MGYQICNHTASLWWDKMFKGSLWTCSQEVTTLGFFPTPLDTVLCIFVPKIVLEAKSLVFDRTTWMWLDKMSIMTLRSHPEQATTMALVSTTLYANNYFFLQISWKKVQTKKRFEMKWWKGENNSKYHRFQFWSQTGNAFCHYCHFCVVIKYRPFTISKSS